MSRLTIILQQLPKGKTGDTIITMTCTNDMTESIESTLNEYWACSVKSLSIERDKNSTTFQVTTSDEKLINTLKERMNEYRLQQNGLAWYSLN